MLKEWGVNKGLWLTQMRVKQKIDKVQPFKYVPLTDGAKHGETRQAE